MFSGLVQLAMFVCGLIYFVAILDYQRLINRHAMSVQVQRHLGELLVERAMARFPDLTRIDGFSVDLVQNDLDGVIQSALSRKCRRNILTGQSSETHKPAIRVIGNVEEWVLTPLAASRVRVTLQVLVPGKTRQTDSVSAKLAETEPIQFSIIPKAWRSSSVGIQQDWGSRFWSGAACLGIPCLIGVLGSYLVRPGSQILGGMIILVYLIGIGWSAWYLFQDFEGQQFLWLAVLMASGWILQHVEVWTQKTEEAKLHS